MSITTLSLLAAANRRADRGASSVEAGLQAWGSTFRASRLPSFEALRVNSVKLIDGNVTIAGAFGKPADPKWMSVTVTITASDGTATVAAYKSVTIGGGATGLFATRKLGSKATAIAVNKAKAAVYSGMLDVSPALAAALANAARPAAA